MKSRSKGAAIVEFALAALVFFTVLFAIVDFGYLFWVNLTMQHAVREGVRLAVTGTRLANPDPALPALSRYDSAIAEMTEQSMGLWNTVSPVVTIETVDSTGVISTLPAGDIGAPGQIIVLSVDCTTPLLTPFIAPFFPGGVYNFRVSTTMKHEAFP